MKTSELTGAALDWAVATLDGYTNLRRDWHRFSAPNELIMDPPRKAYGAVALNELNYSTDWSQGGPIIEREWNSICRQRIKWAVEGVDANEDMLLAFWMRCFVASKLGEEVDISEELK